MPRLEHLRFLTKHCRGFKVSLGSQGALCTTTRTANNQEAITHRGRLRGGRGHVRERRDQAAFLEHLTPELVTTHRRATGRGPRRDTRPRRQQCSGEDRGTRVEPQSPSTSATPATRRRPKAVRTLRKGGSARHCSYHTIPAGALRTDLTRA